MVKQVAFCTNVIDGDTLDADDRNIRIRLARVNAPQIATTEGRTAKVLLESYVLNKSISYEVVAIDTYGRSLAEVWVDSTNVNDAMIAHGYK